MQGKSLKNGEITQEIKDMSRTYRLLGSDKYDFKNMFLKNDFLKQNLLISELLPWKASL